MNPDDVTREIMGNVPPWMGGLFYALAFAALGWSAWCFAERARRRREGRRSGVDGVAPSGWLPAIANAGRYLAFHRQLLRDPYAGVAHLLTFYGFVILFIGTCLVFLEHQTPLHFFYGWFYQWASLVVDLGGIAFLIGLGMFLWRRHGGQERRSYGRGPGGSRILREGWVAALGWLLFAIGVTGFLLEAARIARDLPAFEVWSIAGYSGAVVLRAAGVSGATALALHRFLWGTHAVLCAGFFAMLSWKFFGHMAYGLASWVARSTQPLAVLKHISLDGGPSPGATQPRHLSRWDLLQVDACTTCGRCNSVCPAEAAGKPLHPREIVLGIRQALDASPAADLAGWIADDALWSCTTCAACSAACPVGIDVHGKIIELRRGRVEAGYVPAAAEQLFESAATRWNPFQKPNEERLVFAQDLPIPVARPDEPVELLYWIGCAGSFDPQGQSVARSMIKILNRLGVSYRVLGTKERCTGDPARRLGEEGLFQELARDNLATFRQHRVQRILTHCPHCWNTMRNEYPHLQSAPDAAGAASGVTSGLGSSSSPDRQGAGAATREQTAVPPLRSGLDGVGLTAPTFEVVHHSQFLAELVGSGRITLQPSGDESVTFHDPCYLGRGNGVTEAPRAVLAALPDKESVEMPRHGQNSFCCGAGGGSMWLDVRGQERIESIRFREAAATGARTIATACPFCKTMLEAARTAQAGDAAATSVRQVKDIAELAAEAMGL